MDFSDICRLCYLVNACLSETAKSAPEVRTVCLQLPLKHINMVLVISKHHRNTQHKILSKHEHPIRVHSHWDHVISLILALSKQQTILMMCHSWGLYVVHLKHLPQNKVFTIGGEGAKKPYKCPELQMSTLTVAVVQVNISSFFPSVCVCVDKRLRIANLVKDRRDV